MEVEKVDVKYHPLGYPIVYHIEMPEGSWCWHARGNDGIMGKDLGCMFTHEGAELVFGPYPEKMDMMLASRKLLGEAEANGVPITPENFPIPPGSHVMKELKFEEVMDLLADAIVVSPTMHEVVLLRNLDS